MATRPAARAGIERAVAELDGGALQLLRGQLTHGAGGQSAGAAAACGARASATSTVPSSRRPPARVAADYEARHHRPAVPAARAPRGAARPAFLPEPGRGLRDDRAARQRRPAGALRARLRGRPAGAAHGHLAAWSRAGSTSMPPDWRSVPAAGRPTQAALAFGWGTNEYMRSRGGYGVTLECGQHQRPGGAGGGLPGDPVGAAAARHDRAEPARRAPPPAPGAAAAGQRDRPAAIRTTASCANGPPSIRSARGEPIGRRADGSLLQAERDGFIVFPNAEAAPGTEWFYFAVESERDLARVPGRPAH